MWTTHSSERGPQRSGPMGTMTTLTPRCGEISQRMSTSSSRASAEKSAETCMVAVSVSTPNPTWEMPTSPGTVRPPSAPMT
jgi:hypothetical protein